MAGGAGDVDAPVDGMDPGRTRIGNDDARGAEDRKPAFDAEPPVEGLLGQFLAARNGDGDIDAALINPAGYTTSSGPLRAAIAQVRFPVIEVHASNPTSRGSVSNIQPVSKGSVYGFGVYGYYLALEGVKQMSNGQ